LEVRVDGWSENFKWHIVERIDGHAGDVSLDWSWYWSGATAASNADSLGELRGDRQVVVAAASAAPVTYEVELVPPGAGDGPIIMPKTPSLSLRLVDCNNASDRRGSIALESEAPPAPHGTIVSEGMRPAARCFRFEFPVAEFNRSLLQSATQLRYQLVAVPQSDPLLQANSTCGLFEAMRRGRAVEMPIAETAAPPRTGAGLVGATLSAASPILRDEMWVNVLVTLEDNEGRQFLARSYTAFNLSASSLPGFAGAGFVGPRKHKGSPVFLGVFLLLVGVCCGQRFCGAEDESVRSAKGFAEGSVELEAAYDNFKEDQSGALFARRSGDYVPPGV
jgi:hypothetical protein